MSEFTLLELHLHDGVTLQWGGDDAGVSTDGGDARAAPADGSGSGRGRSRALLAAALVLGLLAAAAVALKRRDGGVPEELESVDDRIGT